MVCGWEEDSFPENLYKPYPLFKCWGKMGIYTKKLCARDQKHNSQKEEQTELYQI